MFIDSRIRRRPWRAYSSFLRSQYCKIAQRGTPMNSTRLGDAVAVRMDGFSTRWTGVVLVHACLVQVCLLGGQEEERRVNTCVYATGKRDESHAGEREMLPLIVYS